MLSVIFCAALIAPLRAVVWHRLFVNWRKTVASHFRDLKPFEKKEIRLRINFPPFQQ